jgi:hypothetical protein
LRLSLSGAVREQDWRRSVEPMLERVLIALQRTCALAAVEPAAALARDCRRQTSGAAARAGAAPGRCIHRRSVARMVTYHRSCSLLGVTIVGHNELPGGLADAVREACELHSPGVPQFAIARVSEHVEGQPMAAFNQLSEVKRVPSPDLPQ